MDSFYTTMCPPLTPEGIQTSMESVVRNKFKTVSS